MKYYVIVSDEPRDGVEYTYDEAVALMEKKADSVATTLTTGGASMMSDPENWSVDIDESKRMRRTVWLNNSIFKAVSIAPILDLKEIPMGNLGQSMEHDEVTQNLNDVTHRQVVAYALHILQYTFEHGDGDEIFSDFYQFVTGDNVPDSVDVDKSLEDRLTQMIATSITVHDVVVMEHKPK